MNLLEVALSEELHEEQVAPQHAQLPLLCRVRDVSQMEHELNEKLFVLALDIAKVEVATIAVYYGFDLAKFDEMLGHVCREHGLDDYMAAPLKVFTRHVDCPVAGLDVGHEREGCRQMMIFQHAAVVVPHCNLIIHVDEEDISDTGVLVVVKGS